jgi:hypothetical protein
MIVTATELANGSQAVLDAVVQGGERMETQRDDQPRREASNAPARSSSPIGAPCL